MERNNSVAKQAKVPQIPGCLPQGYDENSMLTIEQYATWKQMSVRTIRKRLPIIPGFVQHSRRDQRIHVKTHLAGVMKSPRA